MNSVFSLLADEILHVLQALTHNELAAAQSLTYGEAFDPDVYHTRAQMWGKVLVHTLYDGSRSVVTDYSEVVNICTFLH